MNVSSRNSFPGWRESRSHNKGARTGDRLGKNSVQQELRAPEFFRRSREVVSVAPKRSDFVTNAIPAEPFQRLIEKVAAEQMDQVLGFSPLGGPIAASTALPKNQDERQAGVVYSDRMRDSSGRLLTPPRGEIAPEVSKARAYVSGLIGKLTPDRPPMQLVVNLYSGEEFNAFATQYGEKVDTPILRRLLGVNGESEPVYELGMEVGSFQQFESEGELAFVLGHELTHIFENHVDPDQTPGGRWLSSQAHEVVADAGGIEMMVKAGYDPGEALTVLERMHKKEPGEGQVDPAWEIAKGLLEGLSAGAGSHHHEGVRLAAAQAQVERFRREGAEGKTPQPLPDLKVKGTPLSELNSAERMRVGDKLWQFAQGFLKPGKLEVTGGSYNLRIGPQGEKLEDIPEVNVCDDPEFFGAKFLEVLDKIELSQATSTRKMDSALLSLYSLEKSWNSAKLPGDGAQKFAKFLLSHAPDWRLGGLHKRLNHTEANMRGDFAGRMLSSELLQKQIAPLVCGDKKMEDFFRLLPAELAQVAKAETWSQGNHVNRLVGLVGSSNDLCDESRDGLVAELETQLKQSDDTPLPSTWRFGDALAKLDSIAKSAAETQAKVEAEAKDGSKVEGRGTSIRTNSSVLERFQGKMEPLTSQFEAFRLSEAKRLLKPEKNQKMGECFFKLLSSVEDIPAPAELKEVLVPALVSYARYFNRTENLGPVEEGVLDHRLASNEGLAKLLVEALEQPSSSQQDRDELLQFSLAQIGYDKVPTHDEKDGEPYRKLAAHLVRESPSKLISRIERDCSMQSEWHLSIPFKEAGVPLTDRSTSSLSKAVKKLDGKQIKWLGNLQAAISREQNPRMSVLTLLGYDRERSPQLAERFGFKDLKRMVRSVDSLKKRLDIQAQSHERISSNSHLSSDGGVFLMDVLAHSLKEEPSLKEFHKTLAGILDSNSNVLHTRRSYKEKLDAFVYPRLKGLPDKQVETWLAKSHVLDLLDAEHSSALLTRLISSPENGLAWNRPALGQEIKRLDSKLKLREKYPLVFRALRADVARDGLLQPGELDGVFPPDERTVTQQTELHRVQIRGLSAMVSASRAQSVPEQLDFVDYLMGRQDEMPAFVEKLQKDLTKYENYLNGVPTLMDTVADARRQLLTAEPLARLLVADSFMAGPNSFLRDPKGKEEFLNRILEPIRPEHQKMAHHLAEVLLEAHGRSDSLAVAYILSQPPTPGQKGLDEAEVMSRLFDAYGVPGIKFKQYLAFTSDFAEFRSVFESSQDSANPLDYYQAACLLEKQFGSDWPRHLKVQGILGSGSVNVAVRYQDTKSGKDGVACVLRENVEEASAHDFRRLNRFLELFTKAPRDEEKFGWMKGLVGTIQDSVSLEFDKQAAFEMQESVQPLYNRRVNGWDVRTVKASGQEHQTIFMDVAPGKTARRVFQNDPQSYRSAMGAMAQVETDVLLGIGADQTSEPKALHANPDFHDGQVLIDTENHQVTLLDFGQAVPIDNQQREYGLDLLSTLSGKLSPQKAADLINERAPEAKVSAEELADILAREDSMDAFIRLLGLMETKGNRIPLPVVHWVMAVNRQKALGEKIEKPLTPMLRNLLLTRQAGGSLKLYNMARLGRRTALNLAGSMVGGLTGWVSSWASSETSPGEA
jgi:ABC1 atypical kinase-like domain/Peptidase family M48